MKAPGWGASRFRGVEHDGRNRARPWFAVMRSPASGRVLLGHWATQQEAARAYDRAVLHYLGPDAPRNFPSVSVARADAATLQAEARAAFKAQTTSRFQGVKRPGGQKAWVAEVRIPGSKQVTLGCWNTEREAALAHDRAARHFRLPRTQLNFPKARVTPADVATLRAEAFAQTKKDTSSRFRGVSLSSVSGRWQAFIKRPAGPQLSLGIWATEEEAAQAYDRAARFLFGRKTGARLNFPSRNLTPAPPEQLRREANRLRKLVDHISRFDGVHWRGEHETRPWTSHIWVGKGKRRKREFLGAWPSEREAADVRDRAAQFYLGPRAQLNLPDRNSPRADGPTLRSEAFRQVKETKTSRYLGVSWHRAGRRWTALIRHEGRQIYLGLFRDERAAAQAYDAKALELRGREAKVNFNPETGEPAFARRVRVLIPD